MEEDLTDEQWALIAPLLPPPKGTGRPRADDHLTPNVILRVLHSGASDLQWQMESGADSWLDG